ncbi:FliH/SctL family protein [Neptuniibacter halophilus]|uniref:FliH/SctL family protein n=1 Tax=Neptuniibacter halophilus TaxID=651666 RepID=UPI00257335C0|nr:FliH/SctL family protein [Neptuniibacter halophilus]
MSDKKVYKRIRAEEAAGLLGWELPQMGGAGGSIGLQRKDPVEVTVVEEVIAAEKITVAELEEIREAARIEGLAAGLEEGRREGHAEGHAAGMAEGLEQGLQQGLQQGEAEIRRMQGLLSNLLTEFEAPVSALTLQMEKELLQLVVMLSEAVVGRELETRKELLLESIRQSLQHMPEPLGEVRVRVNPADRACLDNIPLQSGVTLLVDEDPQLTPGSYQLETSNTLVEHKVEERFAQVVEQFLSHVDSAGPEADE